MQGNRSSIRRGEDGAGTNCYHTPHDSLTREIFSASFKGKSRPEDAAQDMEPLYYQAAIAEFQDCKHHKQPWGTFQAAAQVLDTQESQPKMPSRRREKPHFLPTCERSSQSRPAWRRPCWSPARWPASRPGATHSSGGSGPGLCSPGAERA